MLQTVQTLAGKRGLGTDSRDFPQNRWRYVGEVRGLAITQAVTPVGSSGSILGKEGDRYAIFT